ALTRSTCVGCGWDGVLVDVRATTDSAPVALRKLRRRIAGLLQYICEIAQARKSGRTDRKHCTDNPNPPWRLRAKHARGPNCLQRVKAAYFYYFALIFRSRDRLFFRLPVI